MEERQNFRTYISHRGLIWEILVMLTKLRKFVQIAQYLINTMDNKFIFFNEFNN